MAVRSVEATSSRFLGGPSCHYVVDILHFRSSSSDLLAAAAGPDVIILNEDGLQHCGKLTGHPGNVSSVAASSHDANMVWSTSTDGLLRCWDVRSEKMVHSLSTDGDLVLCSSAVSSSSTVVAAGSEGDLGEDACVLVWDVRGKQPLANYDEAHSESVTQLRFSGHEANTLCSGSLDGLVCLFDISQTDPDEALQSVMNSESSVSRLGFFGPMSEYVFCTTTTETLFYWHAAEASLLGSHMDVRSDEKTSVNYLVDCYYQQVSEQLVLLAGNHSGALHAFHIELDNVRPTCQLIGGHSTTVRCKAYNSSSQVLFTGGEDGKVVAWQLAESKRAPPAADKRAASLDKADDKEVKPSSKGSSSSHKMASTRKVEKFKPY